jgi:adenylate cyclase
MLRSPLRRAYARYGPRYPRIAAMAQFSLSHLVAFGGLLLLTLYVPMPEGVFIDALIFSQLIQVAENAWSTRVSSRLLAPADPWLGGERTPETALAAWRALAGLPVDFIRSRGVLPLVLNVVPISVYLTVELDRGISSLPILLASTTIVLLYGVFVRFFTLEAIVRPVLEDVTVDLPDGVALGAVTAPMRYRMMIALPAITIVTGVVVSGLSSPHDGVRSLGVGVLVAIIVAFTISLEMSVLLSRSILEPITELRKGLARVSEGDYTVRVPVLGSDETGSLAGSFNAMVSGLSERERLHEAFGAFVDPALAERVIAEGTQLEGEEVEVTVLFLDIRGFTAFAEQASAPEVVAELNDFYALVVPVRAEHGAHANKFVGDGLLAVFGAPDQLTDHADRGVAAALDVARAVRRNYRGRLEIGVGVNSGTVVSGTIGGGGHVEFTVIGDVVNTASRVEEMTRVTGDVVLVTQATLDLLELDHGGFVSRTTGQLKGKTEHVALWAPRAALPAKPDLRAVGDD